MAYTPSPCSNCHAHAVAICASCVRKRIAQHRSAHTTLTASLDRHSAKASEALAGAGGLSEARTLNGELASKRRSVDSLKDEGSRLRAKVAADRTRLAALRTSLAERRTTLAVLEATPSSTLPRALLELQLRSPDPYAPSLLHTRQVLLSELLQVFDVRVYADDSEDDDDDDDDDGFFKRSEGEDEHAAGKSFGGGRGEWMIGNGLILPLPGDIHLYPAEQTNAALTSTLHLLSLFATYLSPPAGLPFIPFLRPPSLLPSPSYAPSPLASNPDLVALLARHSPRGVFPLQVPQRQPDLLLAGLAALQYDVAHLAAHVGVAVPLNESGHILFNLYRIALELSSPVGLRAAVEPSDDTAPTAKVESVSLERIVLSLRGTLASSSQANPFSGGSTKEAAAAARKDEQRQAEREARRRAKDAAKATETAYEREERRRKRRAKRAEREKREREREDWTVVGDSLESIRHEGAQGA